jgi:serine/threonine-protein kinase
MGNTSARPSPPKLAATLPGRIAGKYRVERLIGQGGMGSVVQARHELLDVPVAVKVLSKDFVNDPNVIARFLREAKAVARLKSEHVAHVMDVGTLEDGKPYIVMELLAGEDLDARLERGPLGIPEAADYVLQALEAMAHAHAVGIVHRDLKPANLFVTTAPDGREVVKVLDFGVAKLSDGVARVDGSTSGRLTGEHSTLGSPSYMAPEQVRGSPNVDGRADIWALGAILYELVTGRVAFAGQTVGEIFGAVLHSSPASLVGLRPDAPAELELVIGQCLVREPEHRFQDVAEMARALAPFGSGAWDGHVARIEQTLVRAGKGSDPSRLRASIPDGVTPEAWSASGMPWGPEPSSRPRRRITPLPPEGIARQSMPTPPASHPRPIEVSATVPAPPLTPPFSPPLRERSAARIVVPVAAGAALAVAVAGALHLHARSPSPSPSPEHAAPLVTAGPEPSHPGGSALDTPAAMAPSAAQATAPPEMPLPSAQAAPPVSSPTAMRSPAAPKAAPLPHAPAPTRRARPPSSGLPGVLSSPD